MNKKYGKSGTFVRHSNWAAAHGEGPVSRFSNVLPSDQYNFGGSYASYGGNTVTTGTGTTGTGTSSGSGFDWGQVGGWLATLGSTFGSIFGTGDKYTAQAYKTMYDQQQRTNTILWVVIGLVLALGVVLVIRRTK